MLSGAYLYSVDKNNLEIYRWMFITQLILGKTFVIKDSDVRHTIYNFQDTLTWYVSLAGEEKNKLFEWINYIN